MARRCSASRRSTTPTAARPPTRSCGSRRTSRARPRSSWRARTSCRTRGGARMGRRSAGSSGTTRTCRGTPPASWSTRVGRAPWWRAATSASRSVSPRGRPTARCGSSATARGSGACTAGGPGTGSSRWSTSARTSGSRGGCSVSRCFAFLDDGRLVFSYSDGGLERLAVRDPDSGRVTTLDVPHTLDRPAPRARFAAPSTSPPARRRRCTSPQWTSTAAPSTSSWRRGSSDSIRPGSRPPSRSSSRRAAVSPRTRCCYPPTNPEATAPAVSARPCSS